jgi:hypothetical protein
MFPEVVSPQFLGERFLMAPDGNTWIQKSLTKSVNSEKDNFAKIGDRLKLPKGWKSRLALEQKR